MDDRRDKEYLSAEFEEVNKRVLDMIDKGEEGGLGFLPHPSEGDFEDLSDDELWDIVDDTYAPDEEDEYNEGFYHRSSSNYGKHNKLKTSAGRSVQKACNKVADATESIKRSAKKEYHFEDDKDVECDNFSVEGDETEGDRSKFMETKRFFTKAWENPSVREGALVTGIVLTKIALWYLYRLARKEGFRILDL